MKANKKEIKQLLEAGKLYNLTNFVITDGTQSDLINALKMMFDLGREQYDVEFESLPYSRGGKYARHTTTLHSTQQWVVSQDARGAYFIDRFSTSKSANCPLVEVPKFYTEKGKAFHNAIIESKISELKQQLL